MYRIIIISLLLFTSLFSQSSVYFDGNDELTEVVGSPFRGSDESGAVVVWARVDAIGGAYHCFFSTASSTSNDRWSYFAVNSAGNLIVTVDTLTSYGAIAGDAFPTGEFVHCVFQSDGTQYNIYQNGVKQTITPAWSGNNGDWFASLTTGNRVSIGYSARLSKFVYATGYVDEVAVFSDTLTQAQITSYYNKGIHYDLSAEDSLVFYARCNEGTGTTVTDAIGGLVFDFAASTADPSWASVGASQIVYVDADKGDDTNSTITMTTALASFDSINTTGVTLNPETTISLRTNDTWREQLTVPSLGTSGNPITFTKYDSTGESGADPIISGAELADGWVYHLPVTANLLLWLDGELSTISTTGAGVSTWEDISGNNNDAVQATDGDRPLEATVGGINCVQFDRSNTEFLNLSDSIANTDVTIFAVIRLADEATDRSLFGGPNNQTITNQMLSDETYRLVNPGEENLFTSTTPLTAGQFEVTAIKYSAGGGKVKYWLNGTADGTGTNTTTISDSIAYIGKFAATDFFSGEIAAFLLYGDTLSEANIGIVNNYLVDRFTTGSASTNYILTGISTQPVLVNFNDSQGTLVGSSALVVAQDDWFWTTAGSDTLFINTLDTTNIEYGQRANCIVATSKDYITIDGLLLEGSQQQSVLNTTGDNWIVQNCTFQYSSRTSDAGGGYYGALAFEGPDTTGTITGNTFIGIYGDGIWADQGDSLTITSNTFTNMYGLYADGMHLLNSDHFLIQSNTVSNTTIGGIKIQLGEGGTITQNTISNVDVASITFSGDTVYVTRNTCYGAVGSGANVGSGIEVNSSAVTTYGEINYNLIYDCEYGMYFVGGAAETRELKVYNNTIYSDSEVSGISSDASTELFGEIKNNIIWVPSASAEALRVGAITAGETIVSDYNLIGPEATNYIYFTGTAYSTLATYVAGKSQDANSIMSDPLFTTAGSDFTLQSTSPAINAGVSVGLVLDYAGNTVPFETLPDIGAYEYQLSTSTGYELRFPRFKDFTKFPRR